MNTEKLTQLKSQALLLQKKYDKFIPAAFFLSGFLFDILTLSQIDDLLTLIQQGIYITTLFIFLYFRTLEHAALWTASERIAKIWQYNNEILHFIFGSLLSSYTLFYFVSGSLATSFAFLLFISSLLILNEWPKFQSQNLMVKYALLGLCLFSYLFVVVPIVLGFVGIVPFALSLLLGVLIIFLYYKILTKKSLDAKALLRSVLIPPATVAFLLMLFYLLKILPPIPLSAQYIGIYHDVEKVSVTQPNGETRTDFILKYDRPKWKFWQNGAQTFTARTGDKIHCFVRVFAPGTFKDEFFFHWLKKGRLGWESQDRIANTITGGRKEGFRGVAMKSNFEPGEWQVQIETSSGQEMGRLYFTVIPSSDTEPRVFNEDRF